MAIQFTKMSGSGIDFIIIDNRVPVMEEAKKVAVNYKNNPSEISGSVVNIHQDSPFLTDDGEGEPEFSGSRWKHVIYKKA